ncbi:MAG: hypothetical protein R2794_08855 [Chitinophagales bacterium]
MAQVNSPYSRFGLGNIFPATFSSANGMGGQSAAYFTTTNINFLNPASYAEFTNATFEIGGYGNVLKLETNTENYTSGDGNLSYMAFGFPFLRKLHNHYFGMSFGLIPYSGFEYDVVEQQDSGDPDLGIKQYDYVGDGKVYRVYGGVGYKFQTKIDSSWKFTDSLQTDTLWKYKADQFSVGINASALFGNLRATTIASFPDIISSQDTKLSNDTRVNGSLFQYGIGYQKQYIRKPESKKYRDVLVWRFGAYASPAMDLDARQNILWTNIVKSGNYEFPTDTLYMAPDTAGFIHMPLSYSAGAGFSFFSTSEDKNMFSIYAQYEATKWSGYSGFQDAGELADSWRISLGAEFIPKNPGNDKKITRSVVIRAGAYTGYSNVVVDGEQLKEGGGTLGVSIPIGVGKNSIPILRYSTINLYTNIGSRGNTDTIRETYYRFGVGFTLVDSNWFKKYLQD